MKTLQEPQGTSEEVKQSLHASPNSQSSQQISPGPDALMADSDGASVPNNENSKKVSREDIELVQSLIERCLLLYMNRSEVVKILRNRAKIEPGFTSLVWQKLEEENAEFFRAYYIRLMLKKQILLFNNLLEHQYHLVNHTETPKAPLAPVQNGIHLMAVNNVPMGYPVLQQPALSATAPPHLDSMGLSSCHVVNGVPAQGNFHPIRMNSGNDMMIDKTTNMSPAAAPCSAMSSMTEMAVSPASVASSGHFPFTSSDITGIGIDSSVLDSAFTSDMGTSGELQLGIDGGPGTSKDTLRSGGQLPWTLSLTDLTADLTNLEDLGPLGNYTGSPFLPDTDLMLDADQDDIVEDYFADNINDPSSQSDEEKP
ncbi:unnamed protein product [Spirodela intermedia]|uniref:Uncharacterized protein n=1 Tax=Spirodela intermedia TaxID=51605 RepID=A0A7I8KXY7_SPIIN|nr:unnamed protein product [Spirodela intermedia]